MTGKDPIIAIIFFIIGTIALILIGSFGVFQQFVYKKTHPRLSIWDWVFIVSGALPLTIFVLALIYYGILSLM